MNWGCIPSKALIKSAETYQILKHPGVFGVSCDNVEYDFAKVVSRSRGVADKMANGIEFLFKKNKVDYFVGRGHVSVPGIVEITDGPDKGKFLSTRNILLATGCKPRKLPDLPVDGERVMTSREALEMKKQPKSICIVGAGAIGVEFAYILNSFGTEVTLVEMAPNIVPVEDKEVSKLLARIFKKNGVKIHEGTRCEDIEVGKKSVRLDLVKDDKRETIEVESLLLAIGVEAYTEGLISPKINLKKDRGYLVVDEKYETSVKGIYAAGDIIGPPWLAHVATFEAVNAVNGMFGEGKALDVGVVPGCTYCIPQIASVGLTEEKAKEQKLNYKVGKFPFQASGKAVASDHPDGFVKLIVDAEYGEILGAHIIGHDATELIQEYVLAMQMELTVDDVHHTIHAHPTLSEALMEAAGVTMGGAIHI